MNKPKKLIRRCAMILIVALLSAAALTAHAMSVQLSQDGDGGYYYNMPNLANLLELDLTDKPDGFTFKLYDDGGAEGNYSQNCNNALVITAPQNFVLKISGSGTTDGYDYVSVYDGDTSTRLGTGDYSGEFVMQELTSTDNVLKVRFYSNGYTNVQGYELTVRLVDYSQTHAHVSYAYEQSVKSYWVDQNSSIELRTFASMFTLPERKLFSGWQNGETLYQEGDSVTVTENITFTAVLEDEPVILSDGEGGYYSKIPRNGTVTADLSDRAKNFTLKVYDHGGKNGSYSYGTGIILIEAPEGYILSVNGTLSTYKGYDYLTLYDGDSTTQIGPRFEGSSVTMNDYYTTGNVLKLRFYAYYSSGYSGLDLNVTVVDPADTVALSFDAGAGSGTMADLRALPGSRITIPECGFTLPDNTYFDYYTDGTNNWNSGDVYTVSGSATLTAVYIDKCTVTYQSRGNTATAYCRKGAEITLPTCLSKFSAPYRAEFTGWQSGGTNYNEGDRYTVNGDVTFTAVLNELPILIDDGEGNYHIDLPAKEYVPCSLADRSNGFSFRLYDNGGAGGYYSNSCNGGITLTAPENYQFFVSGSGQTENNYDYLYIYDSDETQIGQYCGTFTVSQLSTSGNSVKIAFTSDNSSTRSGVDLTVMIYNPATRRTLSLAPGESGSGTMEDVAFLAGIPFELPECGFTALSSVIFAGWTDGTDTWQAGETVTFTADKQLTAVWAESCGVTYAYNGNTNVVRKPKGSVITLPAFTDYYTLQNKKQFAGWQEHYSGTVYQAGDTYVLNEATQFDALVEDVPLVRQAADGTWYALMPYESGYSLCSDRADLSGKSAYFSFHLYDEGGKDGEYALNHDSVLTVVAPEDCVVQVSGGGTTEAFSSNIYDYLVFHDGQTNQSPVIGNPKYGGANFTVPDIVSTGRYLAIEFISDSSNVEPGFDLIVTLIPAIPQVTVTLDGGGAELAEGMESVFTFDQGEELELPPGRMVFCTPAGKVFGGWQINGTVYQVGTVYTVTESVTVTALWADPTLPWDVMAGRLGAASGTNLGTIALTEDLIAGVNSEALTLPEGVTVTLNLAGHRIDGSALMGAYGGGIMDIRGALTVTDSAGGGLITGGPVQVVGANLLTAPASALSGYAAYAELRYSVNDVWNRHVSVLFSTAQEALLSAWELEASYKDDLPAHDVREPRVALRKDATVGENETWRVYSGDSWINLDLNGHTLDVQGTLEGYANEILRINSGTPGVFRCSGGTIGIGLRPLTADTYAFTDGMINGDIDAYDGQFTLSGGTFNGEFNLSGGSCAVTGGTYYDDFYVYGGYCAISGGDFTACWVTLDNTYANPVVTLSGGVGLGGVYFDVDTGTDSADMRLTVNDGVRIAAVEFDTCGAGGGTKPVLQLNGGYFGQDIRALALENAGSFSFVFAGIPEAYSGQQNWAADGQLYPWRVGEAAGRAALALPAALNVIEENAFEGNASILSVDAAHCSAIGTEAFKGCAGLKWIRLPQNCEISGSAFDGCTALTAILGPAGGSTQAWAAEHQILFIGE